MKLSEFYRALLPDEGKLVLGTKEKFFKHVVCDDHTTLQQATIKAAKSGTDVYYALASFKQGFHENAKGKKVVRVRDNVHKLKALWFDIDFKGGLSNPTEVVAAIREFCTATRMPAPSILVHSGNGVHVYWPLQTSIAYSRWQVLADALKGAASAQGLPADLVCTADPARVLRPIGTRNLKDQNNPKPVKPLFWSGKLFDPADLEAALLGYGGQAESSLSLGGPVPEYLRGIEYNTDFVQSVGGRMVEAFVPNIAKKCGVLAHVLTTNGEDCSEPEWVAALQLAKHCTDGELYYHDLSKGHRDYTPEDTNEKWQQRLENEAGPTLCDTFATYRPEICKACPHRGKIKTPLVLGEEEVVTAEGKEFPLYGWRPVEGNMGMERKEFDKESKTYIWNKVLERTWELRGTSRDMVTGSYMSTIVARLGDSDPIIVEIPNKYINGDMHGLRKELADKGCACGPKEIGHWNALMDTWLRQVQKSRAVGKSVSRMGWIEERREGKVITTGFTAGDTSYTKDGKKHTDLRISAENKEIARHFIPDGDFEIWKEAADFLADQNNPAFTAVLASAFAAPLFGYTAMSGAMITIVSTESGLGKSSALQTAQAVWGHPKVGMNSISDTENSIIAKTAFLKNLPIYWDEIRGDTALDNFHRIAFQLTQGKSKARMNAHAELREVLNWHTIVIGASNESIFDHMAHRGGASNAASARTLEIEVEPFDDPTRAARNAMFGRLDSNHGHAGQLYAAYIATRQPAIADYVRKLYERIYTEWGFTEGERYWCATIASLLAGASLAKKAGIVNIDIKTLSQFLRDRVYILRARTGHALSNTSAREVVIAYLQQFQDGLLIIDQFPQKGRHAQNPVVKSPPKNKLMMVKAGDTYRFRAKDFGQWLKTSQKMTLSSIWKQMVKELDATETTTFLGLKDTTYYLPRGKVIEVSL
jgi:hypothetical protein